MHVKTKAVLKIQGRSRQLLLWTYFSTMLIRFIGVFLFGLVFWFGFLIFFFFVCLVFFLQSVKEQESKESNQIYSVAFLVRHLCSSLFHIQDIDIGKIDNELCSLRLWLIKLATLLSLAQASGDFNCWVLLWENSAVRQSCNSHHKDPELFQVVTHSSDRWGKNSK